MTGRRLMRTFWTGGGGGWLLSSPSDIDRFIRRRDGSSSDRRFTDTARHAHTLSYFCWETVNAIGSSSTVSTTTAATHANRVDPPRKPTPPPNAIRHGRLSYDKTRFCTRANDAPFHVCCTWRVVVQNEWDDVVDEQNDRFFPTNRAYRCLSTRRRQTLTERLKLIGISI